MITVTRVDNWRAAIWDEDVPSRTGWLVECSVCGPVGACARDWRYAHSGMAWSVATRHERAGKHVPPQPPRPRGRPRKQLRMT